MSDEAPFVHPQALCESDQVGARTRVWAFAHVLPGAVVGTDCNVGDHCFIEGGARVGNGVTVKNGVAIWSGVTIEDHVFVGPNAVFTNDLRPRAEIKVPEADLVPTTIAAGATLGANSTVVAGVRVGSYAFVAAGAVVVADVPDHALVLGVPARQRGWVCRCAHALDDALRCPSCGTAHELGPTGVRPVEGPVS